MIEAKEAEVKKIYFIKNEDDYRSLMVDLEEEGASWNSGHKPTEWEGYNHDYNLIQVERGKISVGSLRVFLVDVVNLELEEETLLIPYSAKPENLGYSFKEILDMDWDDGWKIMYEYNGYGGIYLGFDYLLDHLGGFCVNKANEILTKGRFFIYKEK